MSVAGMKCSFKGTDPRPGLHKLVVMNKTSYALLLVVFSMVASTLLPTQAEEKAPVKDDDMRIFMFSAKPSAKSWKYMKENPGDRRAETEAAMEKVGCKILAYYWGLTDGKNYIIAAVPDGKTAQASLIQRLASDFVLEYTAIELVESADMPAVFERVKELEAAEKLPAEVAPKE